MTRGLVIDITTGNVQRNGERVPLSMREYQVLLCLFRNQGKAVSIDQMVDEIWHGAAEPDCPQVIIGILRSKLGKESIVTVFREGYRLS